MDKVVKQGVQSQPRPSVDEKRKSLSKEIDLGNLLSRRREKKAKHKSSKSGVVKPSLPILPVQEPSIQVFNVDSEPRDPPFVQISSTINVLALSQPSRRVPQNLVENEDLAWERFEKVVTDEYVAVCYDMSLKDFEHFGVHDLFKVSEPFLLLFFLIYLFFIIISSYQ